MRTSEIQPYSLISKDVVIAILLMGVSKMFGIIKNLFAQRMSKMSGMFIKLKTVVQKRAPKSRKCSAILVSKMSGIFIKLKTVVQKRAPKSRKYSAILVSKMSGMFIKLKTVVQKRALKSRKYSATLVPKMSGMFIKLKTVVQKRALKSRKYSATLVSKMSPKIKSCFAQRRPMPRDGPSLDPEYFWSLSRIVRDCAFVHRVRYLFPSLILARQ